MRRREDLSTPRRGRSFGIHYDPDAFGQFSEAIARYLGTARFLVIQTIICAFWVGWNYVVPSGWQFDPGSDGLVRLTLVLSLQAAYAAPLILLAQNRQEDRDRAQQGSDRDLNARTQADTDFLAREVAAIRLALSDVITASDLEEHLDARFDTLQAALERLEQHRSAE
jgi:uncharacterized membrane protein